jgi:glycosyltransferase involved in cell wall biosynthesis
LAWVIETCRQLQNRKHPFYLILVGDGPQGPALRSLAQALIPGSYRFVGRIERADLHRYYSAADLFVFPGIRESLGMVYLEAQACGLPVVAFNNGGIPEVVQDKMTGFLTPYKDKQAYTQAVAHLLAAPQDRFTMGKAAMAYVRRCHDIEHNYQDLETALVKLSVEHRSALGRAQDSDEIDR